MPETLHKNIMRTTYRTLTPEEKEAMDRVKELGTQLHDCLVGLGSSRELSIARTKTEEAVMWAVKHLTG